MYRLFRRFYDVKVVDHFTNPRNAGSLNKNDKNVGTAIVGAPACFHGNTLIAMSGLSEGSIRVRSLKECYNSGETLIDVWSFNKQTSVYEIQKATILYMGKKPLDKIILNNNNEIIVTPDHQFLIKLDNNVYEYKENVLIENDVIVPFNTDTELKIINRIYYGEEDCYTLQVEVNNNYCVVSDNLTGIVVKNCGDVLKLQIKVDDDGKIVDTKFKAFGCGSAISSSSFLTELIKNKTISEVESVTNKDIAKALNLSPVKLHCSMLAEDALKLSIKDYKEKQKKLKECITPSIIYL